MTELPHVDSFDPEETGKVVSQPRGDAAGKEDRQEERVELDLSDPQFMASAYDTYADLRTKGPVSRVRFAGGEEESEDNGEQRDGFFARETFFVTHYDEVVATLLDRRFAVDPRSTRRVSPVLPEHHRYRPAGSHATAQARAAELHRTGHGSVAGEHPADRGRPVG
jgi:hypothetical protein